MVDLLTYLMFKRGYRSFAKIFFVLFFYYEILISLTAKWSLIGLAMIQHYGSGGNHVDLYQNVENLLKIFQTAAVLEVLHCAVGLVRSSVFLTAFQVASRVFLVWGVLHSVEETQTSKGFPMLLTAWTVTEIIRYSFYLLNLGKLEAKLLVWLRYTLFIFLYPIGVTGELLCIYAALPVVQETQLYTYKLPNQLNFSFDYHLALILIMMSYIPIFPQLYLHMFAQRGKVLGSPRKPKDQ